MGNRRKLRVKMVLPVRVWGTDSEGKPFSQLSHTLDITSSGARLGGFRTLVETGDILWAQCRHRKSQFRVVWVGRPGGSREHQVGIEAAGAERNIWGLELQREAHIDDYEPPRIALEEGSPEHRRHTRYPVSGGVEVCMPHAFSGVWAQVSDLSRSGCYIQMQSPLKVATAVRLLLKVIDTEIDIRGMVRTYHPDVGMGIQFTQPATQGDAERLETLIKRLESGDMEPNAAAPRKPDAIVVAERLRGATKELADIDELLKCIEIDPDVLGEFRESLGHVRNTAWALQRWVELQAGNKDPLSVLAYLNHERIRLATKLCRSLHKEMQGIELDLPRKELDDLLHAVEDLFTALAGFDFTILEAAPPPPGVPDTPPVPDADAASHTPDPEQERRGKRGKTRSHGDD